MSNFFPGNVDELIGWFRNYVTVATVNMATLKLSQEEIDALTANLAALETAQTKVISNKAIAKQSTEQRDNVKKSCIIDIRDTSKLIQANKNIPSDLIEALGLPKHDTTPSHEMPNQPTRLQVEGLDVDVNILDWDRNNNKQSTQYIIEAKYLADEQFVVIDTVTATKYQHNGQKAGVAVYYRITPRRGRLVGIPSETVGIYTG
ncbi:MAG: hypothetical protein HN334_06085 [Candidatus Cloacimonetes bacterium]|jgi:hypothetical protein|nr:hypothetical protein [Candidatus Cloacimonadota bacterium]